MRILLSLLACLSLPIMALDANEPLPAGWTLSEGSPTSNGDGVLRLIRARVTVAKNMGAERGCDVYIARADGSHPQTQELAKAQMQQLFLSYVTFKNERCFLRNSQEAARSGIRLILSEIPLL
jgi:hypothetical protein